MNTVTITGNVVERPTKTKYGEGKKAGMLVNFRLGNNELVKGESVTNGFFDVTVFGDQAENVRKSLDKGARVTVTGRLQHRTFERPDGSKGGRTTIIATEVGLSLMFAPAKEKKVKSKE